jgi:energy-coupling factor transporter ATP-binding protein EcfA2
MKIKKIIPFYLINLVFHKMAIQHERSLLMMMSKIHNNKKKKVISANQRPYQVINYCQAIVQYSQQTVANENPT